MGGEVVVLKVSKETPLAEMRRPLRIWEAGREEARRFDEATPQGFVNPVRRMALNAEVDWKRPSGSELQKRKVTIIRHPSVTDD